MSLDVLEQTVEVLDIEDSLANQEKHFRSAHRICAASLSPGMIVESNCGSLYRIQGRTSVSVDQERCTPCYRSSGMKSCPVCREFL